MAGPSSSDYTTFPTFGLRIAGLPADDMASLRCAHALQAARRIALLRAEVAAQGTSLADVLHDVIATNRAPVLKPALVALRRDLFASRRPRVLSPDVMNALPAEVNIRVTAWLARLDALQGVTADLPQLLVADLAEATARLRAVAGVPELRQGIAQSSVAMSARLEKWLASPAGTPAGRQTLLRVARYVARAATKTSPYSTFTAVGLGRWHIDPPPVVKPLQFVGVVETDRLVLRAAWATVIRQPGLRRTVDIRINPTVVMQDGRVWFLRPGRAESIRSVPRGDSLDTVLELIQSLGQAPYSAVIESLTGTNISTQDAERADAALAHLIDCGLLVTCSPLDDLSVDPLSGLLGWLHTRTTVLDDDAERLVRALRSARTMADAYPPQAGSERRRWRTRVPPVATAVLSAVGMADSGRRVLLYENTVVPEAAVSLARDTHQQVFDDLNSVRHLAALFDPGLQGKLAVSRFFLARYTADESVPFMRFYREVNELDSDASTSAARAVWRLMFRPFAGGESATRDLRGDPRTVQLGTLRHAAWDALYRAQDEVGENRSVPTRLVDELRADWPDWIRATEAISCYGQLTSTVDGPRLVVNSIMSGPHRGSGRTRYLRARAGLPSVGGESVTGPTTFAEFRTDNGSDLNIRPQTVRGIDYPLAGGDARALRMAELRVAHDPVSGLVLLRDADGSVVRPVHLGLLSETHLPPAQKFLVRAFGSTPVAMVPAWFLRGGLELPPDSAVTRLPRLTIGAVVLARRAWRMSAATVPVPAKGESDTTFLVRFSEWLHVHDLPEEFFARVVNPNNAVQGFVDKSHKPLYVDVANWFLLQDFVRTCATAGQLVVLEEVLPPVSAAQHYAEAGNRVTEYIFDVMATGPGQQEETIR